MDFLTILLTFSGIIIGKKLKIFRINEEKHTTIPDWNPDCG